jgi:hypothetical protein
MNPLRTPRPGTQRGAAALIVVMLLFFLISLVAAYAGRNLIFEQKTSANQYRATQAFEAAEAGLEWALAMLNGGRIDAACTPPSPVDNTQPSFRQRYLNIDADGQYAPQLWADNITRERPSCVQRDPDPNDPSDTGGWTCSCPTGAAPTPTLATDGRVHPAFRVCFEALNPPQPGAVRVVATGATTFAAVDRPCQEAGEGTGGEAAATVSVVVALSSALPTPPIAALTAAGDLTNVGAIVTLLNMDPQANGVMTQLGGALVQTGGSLARHALPGTPSVDAVLGSLTSVQLFRSFLSLPVETFKGQPATVRVDCSSDCSNRLAQAVQGNPGRIVWVDGGLQLSSNADLGSYDAPAMIVVDGDIGFVGGNVNIVGMLYGQQNISIVGTNLAVRGAVVAAGDISIDGGSTTIEYNPPHPVQPNLIPPVLTNLGLASGSLVRVPGSWRDFP